MKKTYQKPKIKAKKVKIYLFGENYQYLSLFEVYADSRQCNDACVENCPGICW